MRVERIAKDKVRIFISFEDLEDRGIDRDEIWKNGRKVQELFWDMMETAYIEVGFEVAGPIAVEAFTMPTEGVVVIVTRVPSLPSAEEDDDEDEESISLHPDPLTTFVFKLTDFEEVIRLAHALVEYGVNAKLYSYKGAYHLYCDEKSIQEAQYEQLWAILSEYGDFSEATLAVLEEYGTCIFPNHAVEELTERFPI
ncbi:adaptor protein MecA [Alicyclobacillus sp. SO9]|uniref:adaptor protein MecA n=1 Tax=Alicyclobacillus sp. SO9 TaxID=2665646 RepID=UPI0018E73117|nr:adaptor protein MecA [Alicyclobacillus sp. SO9]QQE76836.1 adaptor protein MecA [Alicyclobacillus sp. SO9]